MFKIWTLEVHRPTRMEHERFVGSRHPIAPLRLFPTTQMLVAHALFVGGQNCIGLKWEQPHNKPQSMKQLVPILRTMVVLLNLLGDWFGNRLGTRVRSMRLDT